MQRRMCKAAVSLLFCSAALLGSVTVGAAPPEPLAVQAADADLAPADSPFGPRGEYTGITPVRALDTRSGTGAAAGRVGPGGIVSAKVTGIGGVPSTGVQAVAVNITAVGPSQLTYVTAYPAGEVTPFVSNVNAVPGDVKPNLAIVRVGAGGQISFFNAAGNVDVVADVQGYFADFGGTPGGRYHSLRPYRIADTRFSVPIGAGQVRKVAIHGQGGVPVNAKAVSVTVTAIQPTVGTYLTVYPSDASRPFASNLNVKASEVIANLVFTKIAADGTISIFNESGAINVAVDVVGYWDEDRSTEAGRFVPYTYPFRYFDTRLGAGVLPPRSANSVLVAGWPVASPDVPINALGGQGIVYNLTATNGTDTGYLVAYPLSSGETPPEASNVNYVRGQTSASLAITGFGEDSRVTFYSPAGNPDYILDYIGYISSASYTG